MCVLPEVFFPCWGAWRRTKPPCFPGLLLVPAGADIEEEELDGWLLQDAVTFLGYIIQCDGGVRSSWSHCRRVLWKRFFGISRAAGWSRLTLDRKVVHIERSLWSVLAFYCGTWPPQRQIATEVDCVQRKMISSAMRLRKLPDENPATYIRRRNREANRLRARVGKWSDRWFQKSMKWDGHVRRDLRRQLQHVVEQVPAHLLATSFAWGPALVHFQDVDFLNRQRVVSRPRDFSTRLHVRTGLRVGQRKIHPRWAESIEFLKARA